MDSRYFDQHPPKRSRNHRWPLVSQRIVVGIHPPGYASCPKSVNALPSAYARLWPVPCSWQNSRREILKAKSPSLSRTVNVERRGNRASNTLTGADGLYNGRSVSRQNQPPLQTRLEYARMCLCRCRPSLSWAILRFLVKGIGWRECAAISKAGLFAIRNGARGKEGARVEN